jgi:Mrp family chromosome partitioning ATPase
VANASADRAIRVSASSLSPKRAIVHCELMSENATLGAIRRRWWIIVLMAICGGIFGALPQPEKVEEQVRTFTATHTLILNDASSNQSAGTVISPSQVSLFVSTGEVPTRVADQIGYSGNAATLASQVTSLFDFSTGSFTISTTQNDAAQAELIADTFADETNAYLAERQDFIYQERLSASFERLTTLERELINLTGQVSSDIANPVLAAQQSAVSRQYSVAFEQNELLAATPPVIGFTTLQRAQAVEVTSGGFSAPTSRTSRGMLGGVAAIAVGFGMVLILAQLDRRIRTREQAEDLFDMRSRVSIPKVRDHDRDQLVVWPDRHDSLSDSYRTVRNLVEFVQMADPDRQRAAVTLVVSSGPADGKTSLAANLAAAIAEGSKRTVLVNADFRRPRIVSILGPEAAEPLPFTRDELDYLSATVLLKPTINDRVRFFDLSTIDAPAGELVRATVQKLPGLVQAAESVVIDSSPLGATAEVLELVPHADTIVMVAKVGHTRVGDAQRAIAILRDLTSAPILLVLGGIKADRRQYDTYDDARQPKDRHPSAQPDLWNAPKPEFESVE